MHSLSQALANARDWMDSKGRGAWLAAMILGFIFVWPLGLAVLFYMIWSSRMSRSFFAQSPSLSNSTGNSAFEAYKQDTLQRLEDEQTAFKGFLQRLRDAKDKAEFDQFMEDRAKDVTSAA